MKKLVLITALAFSFFFVSSAQADHRHRWHHEHHHFHHYHQPRGYHWVPPVVGGVVVDPYRHYVPPAYYLPRAPICRFYQRFDRWGNLIWVEKCF